MRRVLMCTLFLALASVATASPPCGVPVVQPVYAAPVVYQTYAVVPAVFVAYPSYTVGLSYPDPRLDEILQRLDSLDAARPAAVQQETAATVLTAACSRCHAAGVAEARGAGITLDPAALSVEQRRQVLETVLSGTMPKGGPPLTGSRRAAVLTLVR